MEHPYTKLLDELDGAHYVRFQKERSLIYTWNGSNRVEVYNMEGACVDFWGVEGSATRDKVVESIERYMLEELD